MEKVGISKRQWTKAAKLARQGQNIAMCARGAGISTSDMQEALLEHDQTPNEYAEKFWSAVVGYRAALLGKAEEQHNPRSAIDLHKIWGREEGGWGLTSSEDHAITAWSVYAREQAILQDETPSQRRVRAMVEEFLEIEEQKT